jgi:hypothetical protein
MQLLSLLIVLMTIIPSVTATEMTTDCATPAIEDSHVAIVTTTSTIKNADEDFNAEQPTNDVYGDASGVNGEEINLPITTECTTPTTQAQVAVVTVTKTKYFKCKPKATSAAKSGSQNKPAY